MITSQNSLLQLQSFPSSLLPINPFFFNNKRSVHNPLVYAHNVLSQKSNEEKLERAQEKYADDEAVLRRFIDIKQAKKSQLSELHRIPVQKFFDEVKYRNAETYERHKESADSCKAQASLCVRSKTQHRRIKKRVPVVVSFPSPALRLTVRKVHALEAEFRHNSAQKRRGVMQIP